MPLSHICTLPGNCWFKEMINPYSIPTCHLFGRVPHLYVVWLSANQCFLSYEHRARYLEPKRYNVGVLDRVDHLCSPTIAAGATGQGTVETHKERL